MNMNTFQGLDERLTVEGLLTLSWKEWLHADIIDAYLRFICQQNINGQVVQFMPTYSILSYENKEKIPSKWYWDLKHFILAPAHLNNSHWAMGIIDGIIFRNLIWHYSNSLVTIIFLKRILISKRWFYNNSSFSESASSYSNGFTEPWIYNGGEANFHEHNNVRTVLEFLLFSLI